MSPQAQRISHPPASFSLRCTAPCLAVLARMLLVLAVLLGLSRPVRADPGGSQWSELARLQRQALRQNGLERKRIADLSLRLRLSALLPQLRATWGRGTQWAYSTRIDALSELVPDGDRSTYSVSLSWDLGRLLFATPDLLLSREAVRLSAQRTQMLLRVAALYAKRCQLEQAEGHASPSRPSHASQAAALDIMLLSLLGEEARAPRIAHCPTDSIDARTLAEAFGAPAGHPVRDNEHEPTVNDEEQRQ
jgi:hypothetical protein